jgi:hypothetical protein
MTDAVHTAVLGDERPNLQPLPDLGGADARPNQFLATHDALGSTRDPLDLPFNGALFWGHWP